MAQYGVATVADLLREEGFSPQVNAKTIEGTQHADLVVQFRYINEEAKAYQDTATTARIARQLICHWHCDLSCLITLFR